MKTLENNVDSHPSAEPEQVSQKEAETNSEKAKAKAEHEALHEEVLAKLERERFEKSFCDLLVYYLQNRLPDDEQGQIDTIIEEMTHLEGAEDLYNRFALVQEQKEGNASMKDFFSAVFVGDSSEDEDRKKVREIYEYCETLFAKNVKSAYTDLYNKCSDDPFVHSAYSSPEEIQNSVLEDSFTQENQANQADQTKSSQNEQGDESQTSTNTSIHAQESQTDTGFIQTQKQSQSIELISEIEKERAHSFVRYIDGNYMGNTYARGGKNPESGSCDCSGLIYGALKNFCADKGIPLPSIGTYSSAMREKTKKDTVGICSSQADVEALREHELDRLTSSLCLVSWKATNETNADGSPTKYMRHGTGIHHVGLLDPTKPFLDNGRLNIIECTPSRGVHRKPRGTDIGYVRNRSKHKSDLHITRIPLT